MEVWLTQLAANAPYIVIVGIILISGFGAPIPEDIPLILAGYLCGKHFANPYIMFPATLAAVVGADAILFCIGRRYGHHVPKLPLLRRYLTEKRLGKTERMLHEHGGKFIFAARFLPGLRAPAMFTAGVFKLPFWKFFLYDGTAAMISAPIFLFLAYYFADHLDMVRQWVAEGQLAAVAAVVVAIAGFITLRLLARKRRQQAVAQRAPLPRQKLELGGE
jgi:membrane protein DedA with SNARE-associated domain